MVSLPEDFREQMKYLLKSEFPLFMETYDQLPSRGLRVNTCKIRSEQLRKQVPFALKPIPWCKEAFYFDYPNDRPGKYVYHAAGLYYIQDPSAMAPVEALEPKPGETVLDLCAAPGGKTTQIAAKMHGDGLLIANEIDTKRIKVLIENIERMGITNAMVFNETPQRLAERFPQYFDRILVDAPCSGEGMFRKDPDTQNRWSSRLIDKCATLQENILTAAALMLRPGGRLVYSTCTFNTVENESVIEAFLTKHSDFDLVPVPQQKFFQHGYDKQSLTARLWPHHLRGEGHFVAVLQKEGEGTARNNLYYGKHQALSKEIKTLLQSFWEETFTTPVPIDQAFTLFGNHLYLVPPKSPSLKGIKVKRPGFYLGEVKKNRFIPSYALALAQSASSMHRIINFPIDHPDLYRFLQGETLHSHQNKGWTIIAVDSFPLSWGKIAGGMIKNHLPKWLRWNKKMMSSIPNKKLYQNEDN